jgi:hypothetical protein
MMTNTKESQCFESCLLVRATSNHSLLIIPYPGNSSRVTFVSGIAKLSNFRCTSLALLAVLDPYINLNLFRFTAQLNSRFKRVISWPVPFMSMITTLQGASKMSFSVFHSVDWSQTQPNGTDRLCLRRKSMILPSNILANAIRNKIKRVVTKYTNA